MEHLRFEMIDDAAKTVGPRAEPARGAPGRELHSEPNVDPRGLLVILTVIGRVGRDF